MPPTGHAYNVDWICSNNSNVHVANHRDWFTSFTDFNTALNGGSLKVLGIGDVALPVKTCPRKTGAAARGTIVLRDVCYAPSANCNIFGSPIMDGYGVMIDYGANGGTLTDSKTGAKAAILDTVVLTRLRLKGRSPTQTSLDKNAMYMIRAEMPEKEEIRWQTYKKQLAGKGKPAEDTPYTAEEKRWLKENWTDEFHFLMAYELSVYEEEDRAEGRSIVRAMMKADADEEVGSDDSVSRSDPESDPEDFLRELEEDPSSHAADYPFSEKELRWVKKHYGNARNFLVSYGLKFYDDEDCQEGKSILEALMED